LLDIVSGLLIKLLAIEGLLDTCQKGFSKT